MMKDIRRPSGSIYVIRCRGESRQSSYNMPLIRPFILVSLIVGIVSALPMSRIPTVNTREGAQTLAIPDADASIFFQNRRTVWDIIWSCVSTIFACCWIAVHPNMLAEGEKQFKAFRHRLFHMAWMIIAPELMICWAITQWIGAKNLLKKGAFPFKVACCISRLSNVFPKSHIDNTTSIHRKRSNGQ